MTIQMLLDNFIKGAETRDGVMVYARLSLEKGRPYKATRYIWVLEAGLIRYQKKIDVSAKTKTG